jgi:DNA replication and repair protein RecF
MQSMWLRHLEVDGLRNLRAVDLQPAPELTVVQGENGQGKSSLLEAVYLLATGRSFRTRRTREAVAWEAGRPARIAGEISTRLGENRLSVLLEDGERKLLVEGVENELESYLGRLDVVDLTAGRMDVLKGGPEERRRFLDRGIVGLDPAFLRTLGEYRRSVGQRNALLRQLGGRATADRLRELDAWDERLVRAGVRLHVRRRAYAVALAARLGEAGRVLAPQGTEFRLRYRPSPAAAADEEVGRFEGLFREALERQRGRDLGLGFTSVGPHRDDAVVELNDTDLRRFGSAGQLRAALIALKLAKLGHLREERGEAPLFLLDDFDTDLDEGRAAKLGAHLQEGGFQTVVATSKETLADSLGLPCMRVRMVRGAATVL